jgi:hypothetical protein
MDECKNLTALEVDKLLAATKVARHEARDRCLILLLSARLHSPAMTAVSSSPIRARIPAFFKTALNTRASAYHLLHYR